jgi:hypothetical protein
MAQQKRSSALQQAAGTYDRRHQVMSTQAKVERRAMVSSFAKAAGVSRSGKTDLVIPARAFPSATVKGLIDDCIVPALVGRFLRERLSTRANPLGCDDNGDQS